MEKILIMGCKRVMNDVCIGCSRCLVGFNRKAGEFEIYKDQEIEVIGLLNCGDCPGAGIVPRLAQFKLWNVLLEEKPTKVHVAPCIKDHCPYSEVLIDKIRETAGCEVILGTHPFQPQNVFG